jgi:hypothetical protein
MATMNRFIFILTITLLLLCNTSVKAQSEHLVEWTQKEMVNAVDWLYDNFEDFDRECFLIGTLDDNNGHYQTFTANKSADDIDYKVKWLFEKDLKFIPDTMRRQRIITYGDKDIPLALFVTTLFNNDYSDLRALRVCALYPFIRHYGSEVKTTADHEDPVCNHTTNYDIELFSSSLAKTVAGYYNFDYNNVSAVSSGGDIGYWGVINKEKIVTDAQKMSFLSGVCMRYGWIRDPDDGSRYFIEIPDNLLGTEKEYVVDILKEFGCNNVEEITTKYYPIKYTIGFNASDKIRDLIFLMQDLFNKTSGILIAY